MNQNKEIPKDYFSIPQEELNSRLQNARAELGKDLVILGHHYQQNDVVALADFKGDSYELSKLASQQTAKNLIFCGVHFMAESADVLTEDYQKVYLPDMRAGCTMADMASLDEVDTAWEEMTEILPGLGICPITYMNSTAELKAFCADKGGTVCTSSNAEAIIRWAFSKAEKLLFFPDQHLGRNVCHFNLNIPLEEMIVWDPKEYLGGNSPEKVKKAKVILWKGHCSVHMGFKPEHIDFWKKKDPEVNILVHPECTIDVVKKSDFWGSTGLIINKIKAAKAGSTWAIGTEIHLVNRLKEEYPHLNIHSLSPFQCLCATMYRIRPHYLLWCMENLLKGEEINLISVEERVKASSKLALERMLDITSGAIH